MNKYEPSQVIWSIYDENDNETDAVSLPDGRYSVAQPVSREEYFIAGQEVDVVNGQIDVRASQKAVAEFLNETGDWHTFVERVAAGPIPDSLTFVLGS